MELIRVLDYEPSRSGTHEHIAGCWTEGGTYHPRAALVGDLEAGGLWAIGLGETVRSLIVVGHCPWPGCRAAPYLALGPIVDRGSRSAPRSTSETGWDPR